MSKQARNAGAGVADMSSALGEKRGAYRDMTSNVLVGATSICRYMRISAIRTLQRWVEEYGFPAIKTPDGKWLTTTSAIDEWIWLAAELEHERRLGSKQKQVLATISGNGHETSNPTYTSSNIERAQRSGGSGLDVVIGSRLRKIREAQA